MPAHASDDDLGANAPDRGAVHGVTIPGSRRMARLLTDDGRAVNCTAADAPYGIAALGRKTAHQRAKAGASDLSLSVARHDN
jgi:hypothetical protein